jgi:hypothetical protein
MDPKPGPVCRCRLAESGTSLDGAKPRDERKIAFRLASPGMGPYSCWGSGGYALSSPDRLVALTDKCHPTLQRS